MANKQIKETNVAKKKPREVDPGFPVRRGRIDATQAVKPRFDPEDEDYEVLSADDVDLIETDWDGRDPMMLIAPEGVEVVSQTARVTADGTVVVDVVLDMGISGGATGYDIRIGKSTGEGGI